jgi:hypothetical protein
VSRPAGISSRLSFLGESELSSAWSVPVPR